MKNLLTTYFLAFLLSMVCAACGKQNADDTAQQVARPTDFVMNDSDLCTKLAAWQQGTSNQIVSADHALAFYDTGIFQLDFSGGPSTPVKDLTLTLSPCTIAVTAGHVTVSYPAPPAPACGGWFQPPCNYFPSNSSF